MKSERRHELQTNKLADWLGHQIEVLKPHVSLILTVVLAAVALVLAWVYFREWNSSRSTAAWTAFYSAANNAEPTSLIEMAEQHAGEPASLWALLLAADVQLEQGAATTFRNRKEAETLLNQAIQGYEAVLSNDTLARDPLMRRRAMFGLAEAHETLFAITADEKHLEAARENYTKVSQAWPNTVLGRSAARKENELASPANKDFLAWFAQQAPVTDDSASEEASSPFDLTTLPGADELMLPEEEPAAPETQGPELPTTEEATKPVDNPESETPAEPAPPSETPSSSDPDSSSEGAPKKEAPSADEAAPEKESANKETAETPPNPAPQP